MGMKEILAFKDTKNRYETEYKEETEDLIKNRTKVYLDTIHAPKVKGQKAKVSVISGGSASTAMKYSKLGKTAVLNFADALRPGGGVEDGALTQEENLCRCSNLFPALSSKVAKPYYDANKKASDDKYHGAYTDSLIYLKDVLFFKDDITYELVEPCKVDVITCPAPSTWIKDAKQEYKIISDRAEQIVKSACANNVEYLVLGAWGCGAFAQDPYVISDCLMHAVYKYPYFKEVVFALRPCWNSENEDRTLTIFKNCRDYYEYQ